MKEDVTTLDDIKLMVDTFYGRVRKDELLGPVFEERIQDNWPRHLDIMYRFWQTVLLNDEATYRGSPFVKHATLPIEGEHFEQWLKLFTETVNELFEGPVAEEAIWRGNRMAEMFQYKLEAVRANGTRPLF